MQSKFIIVVQRALDICRETGSAQEYIDAENRVDVVWETCRISRGFDVMTIYLYTNGKVVFRYQDPSTAVRKAY